MNKCCEKRRTGFLSGIFYGLIPHIGCVLFFIFTVLGTTAISSFFRDFLLSKNSFYWLIVFSFILAVASSILYLLKNKSFNLVGIKTNKNYLFTLFSGVILTNILFFFVIFPMFANLNFTKSQNPVFSSKITITTDIPCSGHAPLVISDLEKINGVGDVKYKFPNSFDISYNPEILNKDIILSAEILKIFKAKESL